MDQVILTIDAGTTSIKVSLFSQALVPLVTSVQEYALHTQNGHIEVAAEQYLNAVCQGVAAVRQAMPEVAVCAIGITTQGETLVPVDKTGMPLSNFIVWLDARAEQEAQTLCTQLDAQQFYEQTGLPQIQAALPLAKLLWLQNHHPAVFSAADKFLLLEDYLLYWLTGRFVSEKSIQTSTGWFSLVLDDYWPKALAAAGIARRKLPELLESGTSVGPLLPTIAALLDLRENTPVIAGAMDQTAAALAVGSTKPGVVTETTGTALVMTACTEKPIFEKGHHVTIYRHAMPGRYLYLPIGNTAGMALKWFRDSFCADVAQEGYAAMDALAQQSCPGANAITFLPYLSGSVDPDSAPNAKAAFFGMTLASTRADLTRSVLEATGYMMRDFMEMLASLHVATDTVLSLGGGARSAVWMQIKADICQKTLYAAQCSEAASEGAALLALWGTGLCPYGERPKKNDAATPFHPNLQNRPAYQQAYLQYQNLYKAVKSLF